MSRYSAMAAALLTRLRWDSRTSLGEPVLPEVDSNRARSSCSRWRPAAVVDSVGVDHDVGFICLQDRRVVASAPRQAAPRGRPPSPPGSAPKWPSRCGFRAPPGDEARRVLARCRRRRRRVRWYDSCCGVGQHRHVLAVAAQVVEEPAHVSTTPPPTTSIRTLASIGGGLRLCWRTMIGAASPAGSMVNSTS